MTEHANKDYKPLPSNNRKDSKKCHEYKVSEWTQQYFSDIQTHELVAVGLPTERNSGQEMLQEWEQRWEEARTQ